MSIFDTLVFATCILAAGAGAQGHAATPGGAGPQQETARLQGTWRALKLEIGGRSVAVPGRTKKNPGVALDLRGDHFEFQGMGADFKGHFRVDAAGTPKRIEFVRESGAVTASAYELEAGELKLIGVTAGTGPAQTESAKDVWIFKREKP